MTRPSQPGLTPAGEAALTRMLPAARAAEPVVTTTMFNPAELAALADRHPALPAHHRGRPPGSDHRRNPACLLAGTGPRPRPPPRPAGRRQR